MPKMRFNKWSKKNLIAATVVILLIILVRNPAKSLLAFGFMGVLVGNQVGVILDHFSKKFRVIGFLVIVLNIYILAKRGIHISEGTPLFKGAFLWGYGFLSWFPTEELAIFKIE